MRAAWPALGLFLLLAGFFVFEFPEQAASPVGSVMGVVGIAVPSIAALLRWQGPSRGGAILIGLSAYAFAVEWLGLASGWPYGGFTYGTGLGPTVAGGPPVLLPLAYVPLVLGAVGLVLGHTAGTGRAWVLGGACALVAFDLVLDPGAVALGYWRYDAGGAYHGVPASNFAGWLVSGGLAVWLAGAMLDGSRIGRAAAARGLATSAFLMSAFWSGIAFWGGQRLPFAIGMALTLGLLRHVMRRAEAGPPGRGRPSGHTDAA